MRRPKVTRLESFVENVWGKLAARFVLPVVISLVGALGTYVLNELKDSIKELKVEGIAQRKELWKNQAEIGKSLSVVTSDLRVLSQKVEDNRARSDEADARLAENFKKLELLIKR